jgi:hypothetical protein
MNFMKKWSVALLSLPALAMAHPGMTMHILVLWQALFIRLPV